jgi:hypothetical protein
VDTRLEETHRNTRQRLEDSIEMDGKTVGSCDMYWILVVQDRD